MLPVAVHAAQHKWVLHVAVYAAQHKWVLPVAIFAAKHECFPSLSPRHSLPAIQTAVFTYFGARHSRAVPH